MQIRLSGYLSARLFIVLLTSLFLGWVSYRWMVYPLWVQQLSPTWIEILDLIEWGGSITLVILWGLWWWRRRNTGLNPQPLRHVPTLEDIYELTPSDFEEYVAELFRTKGYVVVLRGRTGDMGVDLEVSKPGGRRAIVQCKRYRSTVGAEIIRELYGTLLHERVAHAFLVTPGRISRAAKTWAKGKPMTLIEGHQLLKIAEDALNQPD